MTELSVSNNTLASDSAERTPSPAALKELQTAYMRVGAVSSAVRMWERVFTREDRERLGGDLEEVWPRIGTIQMYMEARSVGFEQALVEVARGLGFLEEATFNWLLRELNISDSTEILQDENPSWNPETGELTLANQDLYRFRVMRTQSKPQLVSCLVNSLHSSC